QVGEDQADFPKPALRNTPRADHSGYPAIHRFHPHYSRDEQHGSFDMIGHRPPPAFCRQRGMVLVTALLLLVVVTLLAVGMFRSFGLDEKIAGNVREKQ